MSLLIMHISPSITPFARFIFENDPLTSSPSLPQHPITFPFLDIIVLKTHTHTEPSVNRAL